MVPSDRPPGDAASPPPAASPADVLAPAAELIAAHPGLPPVSHANALFQLSPPRVDLWVGEADHVAAWARALGTHADATTTLEDHPQPSHTITGTPRITLGGVSFRVLHLRYLSDSRPQTRR
jgi:hypothetical protein